MDVTQIITALLQLGLLVYAIKIEHRLTKLETLAWGRRSISQRDET